MHICNFLWEIDINSDLNYYDVSNPLASLLFSKNAHYITDLIQIHKITDTTNINILVEDLIEKLYYKILYLLKGFYDLSKKLDDLEKHLKDLYIEIENRWLYNNLELYNISQKRIDIFSKEIDSYINEFCDKIENSDINQLLLDVSDFLEIYRALLISVGNLFSMLDWQTITYESSIRPNVFLKEELDYNWYLWYKRIKYPNIDKLEKKFMEEFFPSLNNKWYKAYFTNSWQSAYHVIEWVLITFYLDKWDNILLLKNTYYETRLSLSNLKWFNIININTFDVDKIIDSIQKNKIKFMVIEPIFNANYLELFDIDWFFEKINNIIDYDFYVVIDNSILWWAYSLPKISNSKINCFLFESFIKYRQMWLDRFNAWFILADDKFEWKIITIRGAYWNVINDLDVNSFPYMSKFDFMKRMEHLSDNSFFLADRLNSFFKESNITNIHISYPGLNDNYDSFISQYKYLWGIFTLFFKDWLHVNEYYEIIQKILSKAKDCDIQVSHSTSFGFEHPRIALADIDWGSFETPYLRFNIWREPKILILVFAKIIKSVILEYINQIDETKR